MEGFRLLGLGTAVPPHYIIQQEAAEFAGTCLAGETDSAKASSLVHALYRRSGVQTRHSVVLDSSTDNSPATQHFYHPSDQMSDRGPGTAARMLRFEQEAPLLAQQAVAQALQQGSINSSDVTHLITVSCSGFSAPGFDLRLISSLGMSASVARTHVGFMGCHGLLNGLRVARAFAAADPKAIVVVCALELCTLHHQYGWAPQEVVANSLFADGAAAVVGTSRPGADICPGTVSLPSVVDSYSMVIPGTDDMMTWRIGDAGFRMTLSPEVPGIITSQLPKLLEDFLSRNDLTLPQIGGWAIHPGGPRILNACCSAAQLSPEQIAPSADILSRYGNMSSPTVLFILKELLAAGTPRPYVMLGFGPGLNVEATLLK